MEGLPGPLGGETVHRHPTYEPLPTGTALGAFALPPTRHRMWTYLVGGVVPAAAGAAMAVTPGGSTGVLPLAVGGLNVAIAARIAHRRRADRT